MAVVRTASSELVGGLAAGGPRRYQPYLASLNTDRRTWNVPLHPVSGTTAGFPLESPISAGETASSASILTPTSFSAGAAQTSTYEATSGSPVASYGYYGAASHSGYSQPLATEFSAQPRAMPSYIPSTTAYQTGATSPRTATDVYGTSYPRRHTVVGYTDAGLPLGQSDLEDVLVKEEKRRRNKESSQRFRDRTRERQREKQERLDYLERRVKDLEGQVKVARGGGPAPVASAETIIGEGETAASALQRLQRENDSLRAALRTAEQEIQRMRGGNTSVFSQHGFYASLPKLSPPDSTYQALSERGTPSPTGAGGQLPSTGGAGTGGQTTPEMPFASAATAPAAAPRTHVHYPFSDTRAESAAATGGDPAAAARKSGPYQHILHHHSQQHPPPVGGESGPLFSWTDPHTQGSMTADPSASQQGWSSSTDEHEGQPGPSQ